MGGFCKRSVNDAQAAFSANNCVETIKGWQCGDGKLRNERLVSASGFLVGRITVNVLLIIVIFDFEGGSEMDTRTDFEDEAACHAAALGAFPAVDENAEIRAMDVPAGQEMLEGSMIVYGETGGEIGMCTCNVLRATLQRQDG